MSTSFRWELVDFKNRSKNAVVGDKWTSEQFAVNGVYGSKFQLVFVPVARPEENSEGTYLICNQLGHHSSVRLRLLVWYEYGNKEQTVQTGLLETFAPGQEKSCKIDLKVAALQEKTQKKPVFVCCEVNVITASSKPAVSSKVEDATPAMFERMAAMFGDEQFADFEVNVQDKQIFKVHRVILAAQCPYFRAMFSIDSKERREGVVEVKKYGPEVVKKVLEFIYTGQVLGLDACARDILDAATYFQLPALENQCIASILSSLFVERLLEDLELAFAFGQFPALKEGVLAFAKRNAKALIKLPGWTDEFVQANPRIVRELYNSTVANP